MTVTSGLWWSVWWPWMMPWLAAVAGIVTAATVWIRHSRSRPRSRRQVPRVWYYLDGDAVLELYHQTEYKGALRKEVEEKIRKIGRAHV